MNYIKTYQLFEKRVPRSERLEIYRDSNIIVVAPLTIEAHQKYATGCQWCINSDFYEWDQYHKGEYVLIIQRKPLKQKIGISGRPTAQEIYAIKQDLFSGVLSDFDYDFESEEKELKYLNKITKDINSFDLNVVYYSSDMSMYDKENNPISEYNRGPNGFSKFSLNDFPNITDEAIKKIHTYLND